MNRRRQFQLLESGDVLAATDAASLHLPTLNATYDTSGYVDNIQVRTVAGPRKRVRITLTDFPVTVDDSDRGVGVKLLDMPEGRFRISNAIASLTPTTTSELTSTLNASKAVSFAIGTSQYAGAPSIGYLKGAQADILPSVDMTSSATISVAGTTASASRSVPQTFDGSTTAKDVYLNFALATATDIDADATITVSGTIEFDYDWLGDVAAAAPARMPSAAIWEDCPWDEIQAGKCDGFALFEDFLGGFTQATNVAASASTLPSPWAAFTANDAGHTVDQEVDEPYGTVTLNMAADNLTTTLVGLGKGNAGQLVLEAGKRAWFEARVKTSTITDSKNGLFVGLGEEGLAVTVGVIAAAGTLTDKDLVGFWRLEGDGDKFDVVYKTAGGNGTIVLEADAVTLVADTYVNVGIKCNGTTVYFYANNTLIDSVALDAADFPNGEELCVYIASTAAATEAGDHTVDWVKIAQER